MFAGHNGLEKSGQLVSIQEWSRRRADGARGNGEMQFHAPQFLQHFLDVGKQADPIRKELRRDLTATPHHFFSGQGETKCFLVKLDRKPVTHPGHLLMMFAVVRDAIFVE